MPPRKLTDKQIMQTRSDYAAGSTYFLIADRYGISKSVVSKYCSGMRSTIKPVAPVRERPPARQVVFTCSGCPRLFYTRSLGRTHCSRACERRHQLRERDHQFAEFKWIAGTDSWDNIATRLGYANRETLARFLNLCGEREYARAVVQTERKPQKDRAA